MAINAIAAFSVGHEYMLVYSKDKLLLQEMGSILRADKEGVDEVKEVFDKLRVEHNDDWEKVPGNQSGRHVPNTQRAPTTRALTRA